MKHFILLLTLALACCGQVQIKPIDNNLNNSITYNYSQKADDLTINLSSDKAFPGGVIYSKIESKHSLETVSYGFTTVISNVMRKSKSQPTNNSWSDVINVPMLNLGKQILTFVVKQNDGKYVTCKINIDVIENSSFSLNLYPAGAKEKNIEITGTGIKKVEYFSNDKSAFRKNDNTFSLKKTVKDDDYVLITYNNNIVVKKNLAGVNIGLYSLESPYSENKKASNPTHIIKVSPLTGESIQIFDIAVPVVKDDTVVNSLLNHSVQKNIPEGKAHNIELLGLSPDIRYAFILSSYGLSFNGYIDSGRKLESMSVKYYYLIDIQNNQYRLISKYYKKSFTPLPSEGNSLIKEIGSYLKPVFWDNGKLFLYEIIKDDSFVRASDISNYSVIDNINNFGGLAQSLNAKVRGVSINLTSFELVQEDTMKPYNPWLCWADQGLGVVSWIDINKENYPITQLPEIDKYSHYATHVSDYKGSKVWDLYKIAKTTLKEEISLIQIHGAVKNTNKTSLLLYVSCKNKKGIYYLDIETGNISLIKNLLVELFESYGLGIAFNSGTKYDYSSNQYVSMNLSSISYDEKDVTGIGPLNEDINGICILRIENNHFELIYKIHSIYTFGSNFFIYDSRPK